jgi:hypothetical protein
MAIMTRPVTPVVMFITSIDWVRSAPPRSNAFQPACMNAAASTSTMEKEVSKGNHPTKLSSPGLTGRSSTPRLLYSKLLAPLEYWVARS